MLEKERVEIATGEVSRERWYLLTSLSSRRCGPRELLRVIRNHWSVENSLHHVKDRSWDEDVHTLRRPGLGEVYASLVNTALNALRLEGWFPSRCPCPCEPKPAPSALRWSSHAYAAKPPDFAIVLCQGQGNRVLIRNDTIPHGWTISVVRKPSNRHRVCLLASIDAKPKDEKARFAANRTTVGPYYRMT